MSRPHDATDSPLDVLGADNAPAFSLAFLRASPDGVKLLNREGRVTFVSDTGLALMGLSDRRDVVGRQWWELWPEAAEPELRAAFGRAASGEIARLSADRDLAGTSRTWQVTLSPIVNADGAVESILAVTRPV
ncbi:PAS domain-containing protein [Wenxinia marina]|uniref:PAS domain S-box n=1 Tax=Wenxinia marina DSM 24838 TaxID=1123501 RepID=A0A0D0Q796_9RHOB|nr:PAS domain-containing protein [Wenxinia marina]KIQ68342.1 PAS domain S-box [Wenxinia marina DSM 24838]GGL72942.1 hypothetical protein GCM10011392_29470 [Wenxinia marina]